MKNDVFSPSFQKARCSSSFRLGGLSRIVPLTSARTRRQDLEQQHDERGEVRQVAGEAEEIHLAFFSRRDQSMPFFFLSLISLPPPSSVSLSLSLSRPFKGGKGDCSLVSRSGGYKSVQRTGRRASQLSLSFCRERDEMEEKMIREREREKTTTTKTQFFLFFYNPEKGTAATAAAALCPARNRRDAENRGKREKKYLSGTLPSAPPSWPGLRARRSPRWPRSSRGSSCRLRPLLPRRGRRGRR